MEVDINLLRKEIDEIDLEIVTLIENRMELCRRMGEVKANGGLPVRDEDRETEIMRRVGALCGLDRNRHSLISIYERILSESRRLQRPTEDPVAIAA
ncbi:MAG: chorismate mutase [Pyrinomonadaceae bacterium]